MRSRLLTALLFLLIPPPPADAAEPPLPRLPFDAERAASLRQEWAKALGVEPAFTNSIGMKLVLIPGGRFDMGPNGSKHRVALTRPYYLWVSPR